VAGAGSGKTRTLTYRTARLIHEGVDPHRILVATFTNRAAREFRGRLQELLGGQTGGLWMSTLHAAGVKILRRHGERIGIRADFPIYDTRDAQKLIKGILKAQGIKAENGTAGEFLTQIHHYKDRMWTAAEVEAMHRDGALRLRPEILPVFQAYEQRLTQDGALDFSDLIVCTVRLLRQAPEVRDHLGFQYILVDEFQDTDPGQFELVHRLLPEDHSLTAVGDYWQSIYSFRGAEPGIMLDFQKHYPEARVIPLGQNYRSCQFIVDAARELMLRGQCGINYRVWSERTPGHRVNVVPATSPDDEAMRITRQTARLQAQYGIPWSQMAVLYRMNYQSQPLEQWFLRRGIPYHVHGLRFFDRAEIRDLVDYLRLLHRPDDWLAFQDLAERPPRDISRSALEKLEVRITQEQVPLSQVLDQLDTFRMQTATREKLTTLWTQIQTLRADLDGVELAELIRRIFTRTEMLAHYKKKDSQLNALLGDCYTDNVAHLCQLVEVQFPGPATEVLTAFLEYASLLGGEEANQQADAVQLMSIHASKGAEYEVVLVAGCEEEFLPHWRAFQDPNPQAGVEEERRLCYVAMTRAKDLLYLYHCQSRPKGREWKPSRPSRFLEEIPAQFRKNWKLDVYD
jgi:DNA helicase-2/ATP-dependent DNA helicase PcrA